MDKIGGSVLGEELHHALSHHTAKAVDLADAFDGGFPDGLHGTKMFCQQSSGLIPDVADTKAKEELVQIVLLGALNGLQQIGGTLFLEFFQCQQLLHRQSVNICR